MLPDEGLGEPGAAIGRPPRTRRSDLRPFLIGALGTLLVSGILAVGFLAWVTYQRAYHGQLAYEALVQEAQQRQQAQQAQQAAPRPAPAPAPGPPTP